MVEYQERYQISERRSCRLMLVCTGPVVAWPVRPNDQNLALDHQAFASPASRMAFQPHGVSSAMSVAWTSEISDSTSSK